MPLINSDIVIVKSHEANSLTLRYTPTPSSISRFNVYRFSLVDSTKKANIKEKAVDDPDRKVVFDDLIPGRLYEITGDSSVHCFLHIFPMDFSIIFS